MFMPTTMLLTFSMNGWLTLMGMDKRSIPSSDRRENVDSAASKSVASLASLAALLGTPIPQVQGKSAPEADGPDQGTGPKTPTQRDPQAESNHRHDVAQLRSKMPW